MYDFLLFVHVLSAFSLVAGLVTFWGMTLVSWRAERPSGVAAAGPLAMPATVLTVIGIAGTVIFGIWLAIYVDGYELWDGWILASIVLWAIATEAGRRGGRRAAQAGNFVRRLVAEGRDEPTPEFRAAVPDRQAVALDVVSTLATLTILFLMIFKPGA